MIEYRQTSTGEATAHAQSVRGESAALGDEAPSVSVVIPCFNEERFIVEVLENVARQRVAGELEILVVDGMSTDGTRALVEEFARSRPEARVRLIDNPARNIPAALNRGITAARGRVIARMDAHSVPSENYLSGCLAQLERDDVSVVGMPWRIRPGADTRVARANAAAVSHPFGAGDAKYRAGGDSAPTQFVDTVPFGVFTKELWRQLGGFDEALLANEDYDFNYRVRRNAGGVLLDTSGYCTYFARPTFGALARQYFRYGLWKARMVRLSPRSIKLRQLAAPAFVCALVTFGALGLWLTPARWLFASVVAAYAAAALASTLQVVRRAGEWGLLPLVPVSFLLIHLAWGAGFVLGLARSPRRELQTRAQTGDAA